MNPLNCGSKDFAHTLQASSFSLAYLTYQVIKPLWIILIPMSHVMKAKWQSCESRQHHINKGELTFNHLAWLVEVVISVVLPK